MSDPRFPRGLVIAVIFISLLTSVELITYFCIRRRKGLKESISEVESRMEAGVSGSNEVNLGRILLPNPNEAPSIMLQGNTPTQPVGPAGTPYPEIPDTGSSVIGQGRALSQSELATQEGTRVSYAQERPECGVRRPAAIWTGPGMGVQDLDTATVMSLHHSTEHRPSSISVAPLRSPTYPDLRHTAPNHPPSNYRQPSISDDRASLPSTMYPDSTYPVSTLPSYPGTAWSASPPAYSNLSRPGSRRSLGSSRTVSYYAQSIPEPTPDPTHLEEGIWRV